MKKTQTYRMDVDGVAGAYQQAATPAAALKAYWGVLLASSTGRFGRLTDGRPVVALLVHGGVKRNPDHGTTREGLRPTR